MGGAGRGEVAHPWPWPRAAPWLGLDRSGLFTIAQTLQDQLTRERSHGDLGREKTEDGQQHLDASQECPACPLLVCALWIGPAFCCLVESSQRPSNSLSVREHLRNQGTACVANGILLERSTALGREVLEMPVRTRALTPEVCYFSKSTREPCFQTQGPSAGCS